MAKLIRITIPGTRAAGRPAAHDLVQEFLLCTGGLPEAEVAAIAGVSLATLQRWRRSGPRRLRGDIRRRLEEHLRSARREAA